MTIKVNNQREYDAVEFGAEVEYQGSTFIKFFDALPESSHAERDSQSEISADYRLCYICMEPGHDKDRQYLAKKYSVSINTVSDLFSLGSDLFSGMSPDTRHADYLDVTRSLDMVPSKAAAALGSIKSPRKAEASRANGKKGGRPKLEPYSIEWKHARKAWVQDHHNEKWGKFWKVHYIMADTEYSAGEFSTKREALEELKKTKTNLK